MPRGVEIKSRGKFGAWLKEQLESQGLTLTKFANLLKMSRQTVSLHINMMQRPMYTTVIAYCYVLNASPIDVWKLVEEDWGY